MSITRRDSRNVLLTEVILNFIGISGAGGDGLQNRRRTGEGCLCHFYDSDGRPWKPGHQVTGDYSGKKQVQTVIKV